MKPYQSISIDDCGEPLVTISSEFAFANPHAYQSLGAPYGDRSPFYLRSGVLARLQRSQAFLQQIHPDWRILIFDAYRPISVQQFMVEHTLTQLAVERGWQKEDLSLLQHQELMTIVLQFWAIPSHDPATPPPHSTGAAIDVTLVDRNGKEIDLGGAIDEISPRSFPDYYASDSSFNGQEFVDRRELLQKVMNFSGFQRHPHEWWHFSYGDQMYFWLVGSNQVDRKATDLSPIDRRVACYGGCF